MDAENLEVEKGHNSILSTDAATVNPPVFVPEANTTFPYTGIFGHGGFLSAHGDSDSNSKLNEEQPSLSDSVTLKLVKLEEQLQSLNISCTEELKIQKLQVGTCTESSDMSPHEIALSFDHILEEVFRSFKISDLLKYRTVCRQWNSAAISQIQKKCTLNFTRLEKLDKLIDLLRQNFYQDNNSPSFPFPFSKFNFEDSCTKIWYFVDFIGSRAIQDILNIHGFHIHKLSFQFQFWSAPNNSLSETETQVINLITVLLLHQTPNLQSLKIHVDKSPLLESMKTASRDVFAPLIIPDLESQEIYSTHCPAPGSAFNCKLKNIELYEPLSPKLFEQIVKLAPNLEEVHTSDSAYIYFVEPLNRVRLIQQIYLSPNTIKELEVFEKIAANAVECNINGDGGGCLKLNNLLIVLSKGFFQHGKLLDSSETKLRIVKVINTFLECSWDSLENITWCGLTCLPGIRWPKVMPKLVMMNSGSPFHESDGGQDAFPHGFSFSQTFPKLEFIGLYDGSKRDNYMEFINCLSDQRCESVKNIKIQKRNSRQGQQVSVQDIIRIKKVFPFAEVDQF